MQKTVFIVDDSITNLSVAEEVLEKQYRVITFTSAQKMFAILGRVKPDIILLDVAMPEVSGFDALIQLKKDERYAGIPVIFLTALSDSYNEAYGFELGAVDFITKPFSEAVLMLRVKNHLDIDHLVRERTRELEKAISASAAKSNFLSNMSHEMRTPLNAIIGMTAIGKKAKSMEEINYALNKIEDASSHLLGVVDDILDMAKIEANKLELMPVEFDFSKMLQKTAMMVNFIVNEKNQSLTVNIDKNIPPFIIGDSQRLAQVVANLLSNAVKFTPENGKITLKASLLGETAEGCELCIEVIDNGIGISKEKQVKLFDAFEQAENGTNREYGGTGLGLAITKRIVELMGGKIWIESEPGKGARFIFIVKAIRGEKNPRKLPAAESMKENADCLEGAFADKNMLIAEDVDTNREILIALLDHTGLCIDCAVNGKEAFEMVEAAPYKYDIVFMDLQMPKMDGLEATRRIRALPEVKNSHLPIIALTANVFKDDIEACLAAGMDGHLGKPLDIDKVFEVLQAHLN